jgi:hypothetical protein
VTEFGSVAHGAGSAAKTGVTVIRIANHRGWLKYLRHEALLRTLNVNDGVATRQMQEATRALAECLDDTPIPLEPRRGVLAGVKRLWREIVSRGVRYPEYEGGARLTFWNRLYRWARMAAETPQGRQALEYAGFPPGPNQSHMFAARMVGATYEILLEPFYQDGPDRFRVAMADELNYGLTEEQRAERRRQVQLIVRAVSAGVAGTVVAHLGFHDNWIESLGLGAVALIVTGAADAVHGGLGYLNAPMRAARRQAEYWLRSLSTLLVAFVIKTDDSLRADAHGDVGTLVKVLKGMSSGERSIAELPGKDELLRGLTHVQATADRVGDADLSATLIEIETAIKYDLNLLPESVGRLLILVQSVPEEHGPSSAAQPIAKSRIPEITNAPDPSKPERGQYRRTVDPDSSRS